MGVDDWMQKSLHNFRCWTEERDRPIRSAERGVLAWFRDWDDFQIDGIRQDVTESLKSAVRYSIPLDPICFRWKLLSLSGSKAQVLLHLLIPLVTWSVVNVTAKVNNFRLISLDTNRVSREKVCLPSFEVVNCRLKYLATCFVKDT